MQQKSDWQKKHLKRQNFLFVLLSLNLISENLAEKIDTLDNRLRAQKMGR